MIKNGTYQLYINNYDGKVNELALLVFNFHTHTFLRINE